MNRDVIIACDFSGAPEVFDFLGLFDGGVGGTVYNPFYPSALSALPGGKIIVAFPLFDKAL